MDYQDIKQLARIEGISIKDLCALAPQNDPFYCGRKSEVAAAHWFTELWERFSYSTGVHLRRVHYQAVSQEPPILRPNGQPYENTTNSWGYLCNAGKWARYLDLVDCGAFVDRRNPDAQIFTDWRKSGDLWYDDPEPSYHVADRDDWGYYTLPNLPKLEALTRWLPDLPDFEVDGYTGIQQGYHLSIWVEKTTVNDILEPLCRRYRVNLVTGAGEMSITAVLNFMHRAEEAGRPARILYISDYDPAGLGMPISVARKIEFFQWHGDVGELDIRLQPIALTGDQVAAYDLPRVPVKDSDKRKANWEIHHGKGQVELDALEALHPGELHGIVEAAILDYYDVDLVRRANWERERLTTELGTRRSTVLARFEAEWQEVESDYVALRGDFAEVREEFDELVAGFEGRITTYTERLESIVEAGRDLHNQIEVDLDAVDVDTDDYPLPEPNLPEETHGKLYDSERDYLEQLVWYKRYRNGANNRIE